MIYCVIPAELTDELYETLSDYYRDDPNVKVIVDRRAGDGRSPSAPGGARHVRDRRRSRVPGEFPPLQPKA
jgi:hypothetical protein